MPSAFECVGHIAHVNLRDEVLPWKHVIGQVLLDKNPSIRTVVNKANFTSLSAVSLISPPPTAWQTLHMRCSASAHCRDAPSSICGARMRQCICLPEAGMVAPDHLSC